MGKFKGKVPYIILAFLLLLNIYSVRKINYMSNEINKLNNNIYGIQSSVNGEVNTGINSMMKLQEKDSSILADFNYEFSELNDKRIDLILSAKPKVINENDKLFFSYKSEGGNPNLIEALTNDGVNFVATINISIFDNIDLDLIIDDGNSKKVETLNPVYAAIGKFTAQLSAHSHGGSFTHSDKTLVFSDKYELTHSIDNRNNINIEKPQLSFYKNDKLVETFSLEKVTETSIHFSDLKDSYKLELKDYQLHCEPGDIILAQITTKDDKGFNYKINVDAWKIRKDRGIDFITHDMGTPRYRFGEVIIE